MAAGNVVFYQHAIGDLFDRLIDANSTTLLVSILSAAYTPSYSSHSSWTADLSVHQVTASGFAPRRLLNAQFALQSDSVLVFDADDITLSAAAAFEAKYAVCYVEETGRPFFYFDIDAALANGMRVAHVLVRWP